MDSLADGADVLAAALTGAKFVAVEQLLSKVTKSNTALKFATKALPILVEAVKVTGPKLQQMNEQARAQHNHLRAMLTQFKLDLEQGAADKVIRTKK